MNGIGIESGTAILAGQPWLKPERNRGGQSKGQVLSPGMGECFYEMHELPFGIRVPYTRWYKECEKQNNLAAVIARYVPWLGWVGLVNSIYHEGIRRTQANTTLIARLKIVCNGHPFDGHNSARRC